MKRIWMAAAAAMTLASTLPAQARDNGVSVFIGGPGVVGRIDLGHFPLPPLILPNPVLIKRLLGAALLPPLYLWAPPEQRNNWRNHCAAYGACERPVYFVRDDWYQAHRPWSGAPVVRQRPGGWRDHDYRAWQDPRPEWRDDRQQGRRGEWRDERRDDRRDVRRDDRRDQRRDERHDGWNGGGREDRPHRGHDRPD